MFGAGTGARMAGQMPRGLGLPEVGASGEDGGRLPAQKR